METWVGALKSTKPLQMSSKKVLPIDRAFLKAQWVSWFGGICQNTLLWWRHKRATVQLPVLHVSCGRGGTWTSSWHILGVPWVKVDSQGRRNLPCKYPRFTRFITSQAVKFATSSTGHTEREREKKRRHRHKRREREEKERSASSDSESIQRPALVSQWARRRQNIHLHIEKKLKRSSSSRHCRQTYGFCLWCCRDFNNNT